MTLRSLPTLCYHDRSSIPGSLTLGAHTSLSYSLVLPKLPCILPSVSPIGSCHTLPGVTGQDPPG